MNRHIKFITIVLINFLALFTLTIKPVWASPTPDPSTIFFFPKPAEFKISSVGEFVGALGGILFIAGILIFFVLLMLGGVSWLVSGGDKAKVQAARERIMHALIGLTILSLSLAIILLIEAFFGVKIVGNTVPFPRGYTP